MAGKRAVIPHYEFLRKLDSHKPEDIYLIYGEEGFLKERILHGLINRFLEPSAKEFDFVTLYGDESTGSDLVEQADSMPFIADKRLVVFRDFDLIKPSTLATVIQYLDNPSETTMLIVTATKMDGRSKTIKSFLANGPVIQCKTPYNAENLSRWIRDELRNKNIIIESPALMYLSSHIKLDYFTASNEMDKLLLYIGTEKKINLEQVRACIAVTNESNVFDLQNAIGTREIHKALSLIEKMDNFQEIGVMTITLLSRYFQLIWSIHLLRKRDIMDDEIINTHLNSAPRFFRPDYIRSANKYSLQETKKVLSLLFNCDKDLKSLNSDPKVIFTKLVCDICS